MAVGLVAVSAIASCAELRRYSPLELQGEKRPEPFIVEVGDDSLNCLTQGKVLRFILIEGEEVKGVACEKHEPVSPGRQS